MQFGRNLLAALILIFAGVSSPVFGHALKFGTVTLLEQEPALWRVHFRYSGNEATLDDVNLVVANNCQTISPQYEQRWPYGRSVEWQIRCSTPSHPQWLDVTGVTESDTQILFQLQALQSADTQVLLTGNKLHLPLNTDQQDSALPTTMSLLRYLPLGIQHILIGTDHLAFVFLIFLYAKKRAHLVAIISAFTLGHTLTLMLAALGQVTLSPVMTETLIALSLVLLAAERLRSWSSNTNVITVTERFPAVMAMVFGLVHGMGFAGALAEIGLPPANQVPALLLFNVGVEIGQLLFVAALLSGHYVMRTFKLSVPQQIPVYGTGFLGAFFMFDRLL